ncbi:hypothetical protein DTO166G4_6888 [Paecilomyces variotii]|nr:hypothetical protein DTO164E3_9031 [Paecilomyces variotii]KAJ9192532.1 hypothetical protein DTO032I3_8286 [Paecilomyces variotii]KAJ9211521.1 hypothetical protein DTO166G4_6888 [Paecilomyces variotii]KAJ9232019.1 hypothetical protein DTO166G5_6470 [Paecilomyces variotii]KAJ9242520.1 hypothetical protein DTO169E5_3083 [Paecilomyces variotii]
MARTEEDKDVDLGQAFRELADGEIRAAALEQHLTDLESRIEELLATVEQRDNVMSKPQGQSSKETGGNRNSIDGSQDHSSQPR